ncbi:MAG: PTS glucitol/sorbitol transporter subunit IIA [Peptoniphilaceae bacterium]|nr:PTS glucitol/sorbitol transporter subunit IIA [Peptoniphilaceae bacterium]MDY6018252.1 PTS glucitol/sorbitol transporter subunit IIA [Anaerococcus sp.]
MTIKYETKVVEIGNSIREMGNDVIILFGSTVTEDLKDYCYVINTNKVNGQILTGDYIELDGEKFTILGVGNLAQQNLESLGHLSIYTSGNLADLLPGAIVIKVNNELTIQQGSTIKILGD